MNQTNDLILTGERALLYLGKPSSLEEFGEFGSQRCSMNCVCVVM